MNIEHHLRKIKNLERSLEKLNHEDYEAIVELSMLIASHYVNASMHKLRVLKEDRDIKHNKLFGFLSNQFGEKTETVKDLIKKIEDLRPSQVYGRGENGNTAVKAETSRKEIETICKNILESENER